jgi:arsenite-transporting ATPase
MVAAARPWARTFLDLELPSQEVFADVRRLVGNLIAMNEILRDGRRATIRLVMNPDRMVIKEAQRTFTYLNLYGYLTDAVVVNRVFPDDVDDYFGGWRERQQEHLRLVADGFAPVPVLTARYFDEEVIGDRMLDRLAGELFAEHRPEEILHSELVHEIESANGRTVLRLRMPFAERGDVSLKKVGPELVVTVGHEKRTIILPSALARQRPSGARLEGGSLEVSFEDVRSPRAEPYRRGRDPRRAPEPV